MEMLEQAKNFIRNNKIREEEIGENVSLNGRKLPRRLLFFKLKKQIMDFLNNKAIEPRMVGIAGIRGVGKTTLLWQIADFVKNKFKSVDVYFLSMDMAKGYDFKIGVMVDAIKEIISKNKRALLLFDEVQYMENWPLLLKLIYDKFKNCFIIATGSSALSIQSTADLATRWSIEPLYPLNFREFIIIKSCLKRSKKTEILQKEKLSEEIKNALFLSRDAEDVKKELNKIDDKIQEYFLNIKNIFKTEKLKTILEEYIFFHNIPRFLQFEKEKTIIDRTFDLFNRILYQDLKDFYEHNEVEKIQKLLIFLAHSDQLNREKLSHSLGVKVERINKIIESLIKSELLINFPVYGGVKTRIKREKLFFISPTIRYAILKQLFSRTEQFHSRLYEDITALYLKNIFNGLVLYGGTGRGRSPDFIVEIDNRTIPIEVGTGKRELSQLESIKGKKYGLLLNVNINRIEGKGKNLIIPLKLFLLI